MKHLSIIIPCYNEAAALPYFLREIRKVADQMSATKPLSFEFLFVNDGSKDRTLDILREAAKQDKRVRYISFSRNFGKEAAMYAGFQNCTGDYAAVMDADMQALRPCCRRCMKRCRAENMILWQPDGQTERVSRRSAAFLHGASTKLLTGFQMQTSSTEHATSA